MKILDDGSWSDLLTPEHFIRLILTAVVVSWQSLPPPDEASHEDFNTRRLYVALRKYSAQANLPFHVDSQWELVGDDGNIIGIPDIRFSPNVMRGDEDFYVIECKRLRYRYLSKCRSGNSEYIDGKGEGMTAFVDERYPAPHGYGGMIGYVLCDCKEPIAKIRKAIAKMRTRLRLQGVEALRKSMLGVVDVLETEHVVPSGKVVVLHHVFLHAKDCLG